MNKMTHSPYINFNYELHVTELVDRFNRLIKQLGPNNKRGTARYNFEVDFAYSLDELKNSPIYLQGKKFEHSSVIISDLINYTKSLKENNAAHQE